MPRYIDADALLEKAWDADTRIGYVQVVDVGDVIDAPTISPDDVRGVGAWIKRFDGPYGRGRTYCSACGKHSGIGGIKQTPPFCPSCGARMTRAESEKAMEVIDE